uniref:Golgi-associated plant pathogenesis-related protein 1 n=1 Tax=Ficedula albicollis TaxID=59894 RepID=A0A803V9W7_FICAL
LKPVIFQHNSLFAYPSLSPVPPPFCSLQLWSLTQCVDSFARYAEELATTRVLKHSSESANGNCGENLAWASYDQSGKDVADRWYSEIKNYSFQNPGFSSRTGHFTAMVWKNTKKMGVGKASASDGSTFVVARYDPAGNVVNPGYYEENVLPPRK